MIELTDIHKRYATGRHIVNVLSGINLTVDTGECVCLRGPSGTGKTTLLNIMGGMLSPTTGDVRVLQTSLTDLAHHMLSAYRRKHIGFIFQHYHLLEKLTVMENLLMPLIPCGRPLEPGKAKMLQLLERLQIGHRLTFPVHCLSGGEHQRVAVARSLMNDPNIILADEPFSNLDKDNTLFIVSMFKELKKQGKTFVFTATAQPMPWETDFIDRDIYYGSE
ncbi:MAG: ABC transporter ATP-binding protein [Desulfobacteraceae bacterium]|nr:ABC transporter ATP-binding protein [Desulfobacteraceae bacterium]